MQSPNPISLNLFDSACYLCHNAPIISSIYCIAILYHEEVVLMDSYLSKHTVALPPLES